MIGLATFERQVKTCTSVSLPEQFGVQFFKVHKDTTIAVPQTDPLDFVTYWTVYRQMVRDRKVKVPYVHGFFFVLI